MSDTSKPGTYASPPCMAGEVDPAYFDPLATDPAQARDVARWRKAERQRLRGLRDALSVKARQEVGRSLSDHLRTVVQERFNGARGKVLSCYWPIKGEPDLRDLMAEWHSSGVRIALPIVEVKAAPLVFRRWTPETKMVRGDWNIPVPPPEAEQVTPEITLAPMIGWTAECYRLGYGGGYFDRTLAALDPRPVSIGIALSSAQIETIYPQPHDIPLDMVVTDMGLGAERNKR
ncbi:5-formyltetrahydrofolate cyclo-ligase [Roseovarius sp. AK1035]|uniref:5-formyltetrahydrofolate cyclo-ligase n=1 Tax=Roseovarius sp. TM1035 TaxID=391613 RepID=UPI0002E78265|nr:5-formyltetrahydrofolate cyclo-ligase [Roseovarius sp. TM1035]AWZ18883.1 5-formyltetrahydrofolate cyclo-ligase [Roseovarius sp. AK1035]